MVSIREERGVGLKSLHESIDTTSSAGKLFFHVFGALAEFERNLVRERTQAGLAAAWARGRLGGRPKLLDSKKRAVAVKLYDEKKHTVKEICTMMGISKPTLYKYIEASRAETVCMVKNKMEYSAEIYGLGPAKTSKPYVFTRSLPLRLVIGREKRSSRHP